MRSVDGVFGALGVAGAGRAGGESGGGLPRRNRH